MRELFIYYRSHADHADAVRAKVRGFQARLRLEHPGLVARLLRRPEVKQGLLTWMETYSSDTMTSGLALDDSLQQQIETHAACLTGLIEGDRHTEVFIPCAS
ncbi:DUF4936 family protein [uncultured Piscinibacter sp.]|uniref:DUF4936 family protein n=1 Tax=uncultured Piscinibacter sp. TaxID=1131835 RepID=UPI00262D4AFA|nr:DUF4936 family protein [uncultured Piscinibacter sp.]